MLFERTLSCRIVPDLEQHATLSRSVAGTGYGTFEKRQLRIAVERVIKNISLFGATADPLRLPVEGALLM